MLGYSDLLVWRMGSKHYTWSFSLTSPWPAWALMAFCVQWEEQKDQGLTCLGLGGPLCIIRGRQGREEPSTLGTFYTAFYTSTGLHLHNYGLMSLYAQAAVR